ncbi:MAG: hypothetical protein JWP32_2195 [Schumannella sp.]|nr:hypothetical protein [Schumannella sp.]
MHSRALGVFALCAVILAAISFAAVDVTIADAGLSGAVPLPAVAYAVTGTIALLVSIVPAFLWFTTSIQHPRHEADIDPIPVRVAAVLDEYEEDDL